jgi:hypothetical protein
MGQEYLKLLIYLNKALVERKVIFKEIKKNFNKDIIEGCLYEKLIRVNHEFITITPKGYKFLKEMENNVNPQKNSNFWKTDIGDKWVRPISIAVIGAILFFLFTVLVFNWPPILNQPSKEDFQPNIELEGYNEVIFYPSNNYESVYTSNITFNYYLTIKNPTKLTIKPKNFIRNRDSFHYLDYDIEYFNPENFSINFTEKSINLEPTNKSGNLKVEFILNNFWITPYYFANGASIDLGNFTFKIQLFDKITENTTNFEFSTLTKWIKIS